MIGPCGNLEFLLSGNKSTVRINHIDSIQKHYNPDGTLKADGRVKKPMSLYDIFMRKLRLRETEARALADFLEKML